MEGLDDAAEPSVWDDGPDRDPPPKPEASKPAGNGLVLDPPKLIVHNAGRIRDKPIPPRQWLLGTTFCRKFLSGLIGAGAAGKTAVRYAQYLSVAIGRSLTGEHVHKRGCVLIVCLEDDLDEVRRRIDAAMRHHEIDSAAVDGWLFYAAPRGLKLMLNGDRGERVVGPLYAELLTVIAELRIDLVGADPFIKLHGLEENDNNALDDVCILLATLADEFNCAADIIHHGRKGVATPGDADRSRGASATVDALRLVRTLTPMSEGEAALFGVKSEDRQSLIRLDDAKVNLVPKSADAKWFRLVGVNLENGTTDYPHGDNVQTVELWPPPDNFAGVTARQWNDIIDEIDAGLPDRRRYSNAPNAGVTAAWKVVVAHIDRTEPQARNIINTWVKNSVLVVEPYDDPVARKPRQGLKANPANRPGSRAPLAQS